MTAMTTTPVNNRLTCSMAAWALDTSTNRSELQFGQSSQPSPLLVRRTAAPETMMIESEISAPTEIWRYRGALMTTLGRLPMQPGPVASYAPNSERRAGQVQLPRLM